MLYTSEVENGTFTVSGPPCKFYWHVHGKRGDVNVNVEPMKLDVEVKGDGPYKYL